MFKSTADGVAGSPGMHVALPVDKAYNAGRGIVTTQHPRLVDNIVSGTARSIRPAPTYNATVLPLSSIHHDCTLAIKNHVYNLKPFVHGLYCVYKNVFKCCRISDLIKTLQKGNINIVVFVQHGIIFIGISQDMFANNKIYKSLQRAAFCFLLWGHVIIKN